MEATWPSGAGAVVMAGCLGWRAKPATPQVGAQARVGSLTKPHSGGIRGFGERPEEGRVKVVMKRGVCTVEQSVKGKNHRKGETSHSAEILSGVAGCRK